MSYNTITNEEGEQTFVANINTIEHKHEWYKVGKWVMCKGCTMRLLDDDNTFMKVLKGNDSK